MTDADNFIHVESRGAILSIEIRRPEKKNALTGVMYTALAEAIDRYEREPKLRVLFLTGTRDCFTSGNDLGDFLKGQALGTNSPVVRFLAAIREMHKPLVAAVNGAAVGIGTTLLLHCDLAYAGKSARFQLPFTNLGLCPEGGSSLLLPYLLGHRKAAQLLLLGEPFGPEEARDFGLVNAVFEDSDYHDQAWRKAEALAAQPPASVRIAKRLMKVAFPTLASHMTEEMTQFAARLKSPEAQEAFTAFMEKRKTDFSQFN